MVFDDSEPLGRSYGGIRSLLADRPFLVVSNRQPYSHEYSSDDRTQITVSRPAGGVTAALDPMMQSIGGTWIAWGSGDADDDVVDAADHVHVPPENPAYTIRRLWLDEMEVDGYYYGHSNQVIWPLCHSLSNYIEYDESNWWTYRAVNERFADAVVEEVDRSDAPGDPLVWFHDYHLGLAPAMVRRRLGEDVDLVHFWHIPWPPWDIFRRCPHGVALVAGLLSNDVLGFHTDLDRRQFVRCAERMLDARYDPEGETLYHGADRTIATTAPLSVDSLAIAERSRTTEASEFWTSLSEEHGLDDVQVAIGVDRLDYTKGIEERLDALERLWTRYPEWRGRLTYVQKASHSRSKIPAYAAVQRRVEARIEEINRTVGTEGWQPIVYRTDMLSQEALASLYAHADLAIVSPRRDGMNLVAKEFVAAQVDAESPGVLVLSETAGAVDDLGADAVTVNPLDTAAFADALRQSLTMPMPERRRRMNRLRRILAERDQFAWVHDMLGPVQRVRKPEADDELEPRAPLE